jgi:glycosyltransferase involved in cell wall biosynthesis
VNAAPLAPAHHSFGDPAQIEDRATEAAVCDLVAATGPWDVLHLNNLEGLPVAVLGRLKARFPGLRIVLSLHNHFPVCPQVNLWWQERSACTDFDGGRACVTCLPRMPDRRMLRLANGLAYRLKRAGLGPGTRAVRIGGRGMRALRRLRPPLSALTSGAPPAPARPDGAPFAARRSAMVAAINAHCDRVLCVSDAVRRIALRHGIAPDRAHVSYIGTAEAEAFARTAPRRVPRAADGTLTLGFLGYMRRDKGFHFLLDALESLPASLAARIRLVVAARRGNRATMARLAGLEARLASVDHADGYRHAAAGARRRRRDPGALGGQPAAGGDRDARPPHPAADRGHGRCAGTGPLSRHGVSRRRYGRLSRPAGAASGGGRRFRGVLGRGHAAGEPRGARRGVDAPLPGLIPRLPRVARLRPGQASRSAPKAL